MIPCLSVRCNCFDATGAVSAFFLTYILAWHRPGDGLLSLTPSRQPSPPRTISPRFRNACFTPDFALLAVGPSFRFRFGSFGTHIDSPRSSRSQQFRIRTWCRRMLTPPILHLRSTFFLDLSPRSLRLKRRLKWPAPPTPIILVGPFSPSLRRPGG